MNATERIEKRIFENALVFLAKCSKKDLAYMLATYPTKDALKILKEVSPYERKLILEKYEKVLADEDWQGEEE